MSDLMSRNGNAWSSRAKWAFAVFAIVGAFFLVAEHRAHVLPLLPWLILLACPLMHMFMHGGHGGHGGHHGSGKRPRGGNGGASETGPEGARDGDTGPKADDHSPQGDRP